MKIITKSLSHPDTSYTAYIQTVMPQQERSAHRPAIVILPGGAYTHLSYKESEPVALAFMSKGYNAFIVRYTIGSVENPRERNQSDSIQDVLEALTDIEANAEEYCIDSNRIVLLGFSAGGHLAGCVACRDAIHLKALLLGYPCVNQAMLEDLEVNAQDLVSQVHPGMPPVFLFNTAEDERVPTLNTAEFAVALAKAGVPYEAHTFLKGPHGMSLATIETYYVKEEINPDFAQWFSLAIRFLEQVNPEN